MLFPDPLLYHRLYGCGSSHPDRIPRGRFGRDHPHHLHVPVMNTARPQPGSSRPRRKSIAALGCTAACLLLLSSPPISRGDIYRWEDNDGTVHFTDDVSTIPPQFRKKSSPLIREAPSVIPSSDPSPSMQPGPSSPGITGAGASEGEPSTRDAERDREDLKSQVEALKAKIIAKEQHISAVDAKRSLANNPLRNRFVDQPDLDLYEKYQAELPADRERLKELESLAESIK